MFKPGHVKYGGRKKGTKNKNTADIRDALLAAGDELGGKGGLTAFFVKVGKKKPEVLAGWIADLIPRDIKPDEDGNAAGRGVTTVNIIAVKPGTFLSPEECHNSAWGEPPPLLEHDPAVIDHDNDGEPPAAA